MTPSVYFYEAFAEEEAALRRHLPPDRAAAYTAATIQESGDEMPPSRLISIRTQSVVPSAWLAQVDAILTRSTGYDHVAGCRARVGKDTPACGYLPEYCARAVAEHAMLLWVALLRRLNEQRRHFERFNRDHLTGAESAGKKLVVVGVGHIGSEVVRIGRALGMRVNGVDPVRKHDFVEYTDLEAGLPDADVVVAAMDLNARNRGLFNRDRLRRGKAGAVFVNVGRGEHAPSTVLLDCLEQGVLGGVGIDVFEDEPELAVALRRGAVPSGEEARAALMLNNHPRAICTPHNAFNTVEALERKASQTARQVVHFLREGVFVWNVPRADERQG